MELPFYYLQVMLRTLIQKLQIRKEDSIQDFGPWHSHLKVQLGIFLFYFIGFASFYYFIEHRVDEPYQGYFHKKLDNFFLIIFFAHLWGLFVEHWSLIKGVLASFLYGATSPFNLALMRIGVMGTLAGHLIVYVPKHVEQLASLPHSARQSLPGIGWLIDILPINPPLFQILTYLGFAFCLMAMLGLFTRTSLILSSVILLYVLGVPQFFGKLNHSHFMLWAPIFLTFSPAGDVLSIDALIRKWKGQEIDTRPHYRYGLAMKLIFLQLSMLYFFSGVGKLRLGGLEWALSDNLIYSFRLEWLEQYNSVPGFRIDHYPWLCRIGAVGVIIFELSVPFLILSPRTRIPTALAAIGFHFLTGYFLLIDFIFLRLLNTFHFDLAGMVTWALNRQKWLWTAVLLIGLLFASGVLIKVMPVALLVVVISFLYSKYKGTPLFRKANSPLPGPNKWVWRIGISLLLINMGFGVTQTNSWPFSAYPSYSAIRSGEVSYAWFHPLNEDGIAADLNEMCRTQKFQKENILPMGETAFSLFQKDPEGKLEEHLLRYWLKFRKSVPALQPYHAARIVLQTFSTDPDRSKAPIWELDVGHFTLVDENWELTFTKPLK